MANLFTKIFGFIRSLFVRAGLDKFLQDHIDLATKLMAGLLMANNNAALAEWKDQAFAELKAQFKSDKDNWIMILVHLAYEQLKAKATEPAPKA